MRFELKDFQIAAVEELLREVQSARREAADGRPQAIVLSSPTGSGKTVIVSDLLEKLWDGHEGRKADKDAVFLWLSDSPELNEQSRQKILLGSNTFPQSSLVTIDNAFDKEVFEPGRIYFLNTQKLGKDALLTKQADRRTWTIWQTIENTAKRWPASLYLIVDEAHRGMREVGNSEAAQARAESTRLTIVQKFIKGDPGSGLSPVPIILGMSATPDRFNRVLEGARRVVRPVDVPSEQVRLSGLIKDRIILDVARGSDPADWALLRNAAEQVLAYQKEWATYCGANGIAPPVEPVLVVQVEDGDDNRLTQTDLNTAVKVLERVYGPFPEGALAHCFQEDGDVEVGGNRLKKVDASSIQDDVAVKVVFFKTALTTGWDCPRAEVMMSFRKAKDHTLIAQLVGRMVRTPLARRIESNDVLNSVTLSLPHYDEEGVKDIIKKLEHPEAGSASSVLTKSSLLVYRPAADLTECFRAIATIPTYVLNSPRRIADSRRLAKLARMLDRDATTSDCQTESRDAIAEALKAQAARLRKDPAFADKVSGKAKLQVRQFVVEHGTWREEADPRSYLIEATPENITDMFEQCGNILGEGLHWHYWRKFHDREHPDTSKLELFCILQDSAALRAVQEEAGAAFEKLFGTHRDAIAVMPSARRELYYELRRKGPEPVAEPMSLPENIEVQKESPSWERHLYTDEKGRFGFEANSWEGPVLKAALEDKNVVGWLRNQPKKPWSLCVPYGVGELRPMYPDFLVFRREKGKIRVDILDPHGDQFADSPAKAAGLALYAQKHGELFGRIEVIRIKDKVIQRLRLHDPALCTKVARVVDAQHLTDLFGEHG